jgi:hypothetical protein
MTLFGFETHIIPPVCYGLMKPVMGSGWLGMASHRGGIPVLPSQRAGAVRAIEFPCLSFKGARSRTQFGKGSSGNRLNHREMDNGQRGILGKASTHTWFPEPSKRLLVVTPPKRY